MGTTYRRQVRFCTTCDRRLDTTAARKACESAGHVIEIREQSIWWIKYQVGGRPQCVSSGSNKKEEAKRLLKAREGDVVKGVPINRVLFEEAAARACATASAPGARLPRHGCFLGTRSVLVCAPRSHSPDSGQRALRVPHRRTHSPSRVIMAKKEQAWETKVARKTRKKASNSR
jgi:hypothetical protein